MDVLNRKLFANRNARNELARNAGIMASSVPLMQVAQGYQQGGMVGPGLPLTPANTRQGYTFDEWSAMSRADREARQLPVSTIGGQMAFNPMLGFGAAPEMIGPGGQRIYTADPVPSELPEFEDVTQPMRDRWGEYMATPEFAQENEKTASGQAVEDYVRGFLGETRGERESRAEARDARLGMGASSDAREQARRAQPEGAPAATPAGPVNDPGTLAERATLSFGESGDWRDGANEMLRLHMGLGEEGGEGKKDPAEMTVKERTNELLSMYKDLFGDDDKDVANEKALTMAMIGFAIASGTSPNALENIAAGLLTGTQLMAENRGSRREREDRLKVLAMESALEEDRAEKARDAALEDYEEKLRLQVKYGVGEGASRDTQQNENLTQIWSSTYAERVGLGDSPDQAAEAAALAVEAARAQFPSVYGTVKSGADLTKLRLEQAKKVLREGAPRSAVESILRLEGIDPGLLDG